MKEWFLSTELVELEGMPNKVGSISVRANREKWKSRKSKTGGRSLEFHISNFEPSVQHLLYCQEYGAKSFDEWKLEMKALHFKKTNENTGSFEPSPYYLEFYSFLEKEINTPLDVIQSWEENGTLAENVTLARIKLAKKSELIENFKEEIKPLNNPIYLDFYDIDVSAGAGTLALQEKTSDPIIFNKDFLINSLEVLPEDVFLMLVRGDSMYPTLKNQAIIMIKKIDIFAMDGIYVFRYNGQLMVKRLQFSKTGLTVVSDNPIYKIWELSGEEAEAEDFEILGEVIWSGQRM